MILLIVKSLQVTIVSAHRTPERMYSFASSAKERGIQIIIAGAGGAAHLPGESHISGKEESNTPYWCKSMFEVNWKTLLCCRNGSFADSTTCYWGPDKNFIIGWN